VKGFKETGPEERNYRKDDIQDGIGLTKSLGHKEFSLAKLCY